MRATPCPGDRVPHLIILGEGVISLSLAARRHFERGRRAFPSRGRPPAPRQPGEWVRRHRYLSRGGGSLSGKGVSNQEPAARGERGDALGAIGVPSSPFAAEDVCVWPFAAAKAWDCCRRRHTALSSDSPQSVDYSAAARVRISQDCHSRRTRRL